MKKNIILIFLLGMFGSVAAQTTLMQRKMLPGKIDTLLLNYFEYSKLYSLDDIGFSDAVARKFMYLFTPEATITDEANPGYFYNDYDHPFELRSKIVEDVVTKIKENYPNGINVKYNAIQVDYNNLKVHMLKEIKGTTKTGLLYVINDTLEMKLSLSADLKKILIQEVAVKGYTISFLNDDDRDFITNSLDKCPKDQGFRTATGCLTKEEKIAKKNQPVTPPVAVNPKPVDPIKPPYDGPVLPGFFAGLSFAGGTNSFTTNFEKSNFGYDQLIAEASGNSALKQNKSVLFSQVQLDLEFYFGPKKSIGIATGIGMSNFNASFTMDSFRAEYRTTDSKDRVFRRISKVKDISETLKIQSLNIPFLVQYKIPVGEKSNFAFGVGINYQNIMSSKVSSKATADYEAIYKFDASTRDNPTTLFDGNVSPSKESWLITRNHIEAHNGQAQLNNYLSSKRSDGYEVALDESLEKNETMKMSNAVGILARANMNFSLSEKAFLATFIQYQSITFTNSDAISEYTVTQKIGSYNSLLKNVKTFGTGSVALGVGIKFTIK